MLDVLHTVENIMLGDLLTAPDWQSKKIDYSPPVVDRLFLDREIDGVPCRIYLHRIYPCENAFYHPHPWPSAVRVIGAPHSVYEMGIGYDSGDRTPGRQSERASRTTRCLHHDPNV